MPVRRPRRRMLDDEARRKLDRYLYTGTYERIAGRTPEEKQRRFEWRFAWLYILAAAAFFLTGLYFVLF